MKNRTSRTAIPIALALLLALVPARAEEAASAIQGLVLPFKIVSVSSPVQDIIKEVLVKEGDEVKKDQIIAQLVSEKETLQVELYKKTVERREAETKAFETLAREKIGSRDMAMEKRTELEVAKIQARQSEVLLGEKTIKSPLDGIVVKKYKESGEAVERTEKIVDVVNIDQVYVQFYLDPKLMPQMKVGAAIALKFPVLPGAPEIEGKIDFIDPRIDAASGLFRIKALLDNPEHRIKAGMRATAEFSKLKG